MTHFPQDQDDQKLIAFLKQNHPIPPAIKEDFEALLMAKINRLPQGKPPLSRRRLLWFVSGAIAGLLLVWGGTGWFSSKYQMAQIATDEELELFLINGWYGTMGETSYTDAQSHFEAEWSLISEQLAVNSEQLAVTNNQ